MPEAELDVADPGESASPAPGPGPAASAEADAGPSPSRIVLSQAAHEAVREMLVDAGVGAEGGLRLSAHTGAGCSAPLQLGMVLEEAPADDDLVLARDDVRLFLDPESAWVLDGLFVDYVTSSPMGEGFAFRHPRSGGGRAC